MQNTVKSSVSFAGIGLHSGRAVQVTVHAAAAEHGFWFRRSDIDLGDAMIPARWDAVTETRLSTRLQNAAGASVGTVEHLLAALAGCGIHNALIDVDGPEVPILDGSAAPFVRGLLARGLRPQAAPVRAIEILRPVEVQIGDASARLEPAAMTEIDYRIEFDDPGIGNQAHFVALGNGGFVRHLSDSRTFCCLADVAGLHDQGLSLGGSLDNALVFDHGQVRNPSGLRHLNEPVRHKMLDAFGDLALAGAPVLGRYIGNRAGHAVTHALLRAVFSDPAAYRMVVCTREQAARLPGIGLRRAEIPAVA
ncbi:UDP-3-O-acyl-N-acetylglucosamine deacetylase [Pseudooceanicola sp.]|uniref:UDP-3-O-acyl-N-acetylglucosamine deacetylase n=1 Tax=Pseudooceanicola sp. TaxID=1914328 RepID=UPI002605C8DD|nr:UDP-3-O-acyl-N-acetylglucosamine deacetylase [Pseudooceanicola sp.]MDF1854376.1 UDP-3-O-acyl-N-acetylglucosamine deacetylase [Pseudooceanicola sp.]